MKKEKKKLKEFADGIHVLVKFNRPYFHFGRAMPNCHCSLAKLIVRCCVHAIWNRALMILIVSGVNVSVSHVANVNEISIWISKRHDDCGAKHKKQTINQWMKRQTCGPIYLLWLWSGARFRRLWLGASTRLGAAARLRTAVRRTTWSRPTWPRATRTAAAATRAARWARATTSSFNARRKYSKLMSISLEWVMIN